jgi:hypothetical protein
VFRSRRLTKVQHVPSVQNAQHYLTRHLVLGYTSGTHHDRKRRRHVQHLSNVICLVACSSLHARSSSNVAQIRRQNGKSAPGTHTSKTNLDTQNSRLKSQILLDLLVSSSARSKWRRKWWIITR